MPDYQLFTAFLASAAVFAYAPGPSTLYAAAQTLAGGKTHGFYAALGIHLGGYAHVLMVAVGIAGLMGKFPVSYLALKLIGGAYLVWLGISMAKTTSPLLTTNLTLEHESATPKNQYPGGVLPLRKSALVEILNPKTAIFYLAFLPQFTDPTGMVPIWAQLLILGTIVNIMFSSADILCVIFAESILRITRKTPTAMQASTRIAGILLVLLGINLIYS